jgi:protein XRP2
MGNFFTYLFRSIVKAEPVEAPVQQQVFSWEREDRKAINKEDFILDKLKDQTIYRLPGSVNGQQFIIQNCDNCKVYVFDHTAQIQIDDCTNCQILIGPVNGSIFIRDSTNCVLATVCKQFRTRDCRDIYVYLSCESQPIIESSHNIKFGCLSLNYDKLADQCKSAGISPWNNNWGNIHDFTTIPGGKNYSLLDKDDNVFKHLSIPADPSVSSLHITDSLETSDIPYTYGEFYRIRNEERCLVIFFHDPNADTCARELLQSIRQSEVVLVQTKSYTVDETSAERLFGNNRSYNSLVTKGPVIGLEFAGTNCVAICRQALTQLLTAKYPTLPHFISQSPADARGQLDKFYNFASMQMFA